MAVLGLRFCARAFSSCGKRGPLFIAVRRPLTIAASLVAEHRLQTRRLSNRGSRAQSLRGMWDPPRPGLKPVSPALAGRLSTTAPPGKPWIWIFDKTSDKEIIFVALNKQRKTLLQKNIIHILYNAFMYQESALCFVLFLIFVLFHCSCEKVYAD